MSSQDSTTRVEAPDREVVAESLDIPNSFVDFCDKFGRDRFMLEPGQRALASVMFDGLDPIDLATADQCARAIRLFGCERIPPSARKLRTLAAVCGARGGKSTIFAWRLVHLALIRPLKLGFGEQAFALIVAPKEELAIQSLSFALGIARAVVPARVSEESSKGFTLTRSAGEDRVRFIVRAASGGGMSTRGVVYVGAMVEECAFFRGTDNVVNDRDVIASVRPRIMLGGEMLIPSTPWAQSGVLYDHYVKNFAHPIDAVVAHAPTWELRTDEAILAQLALEKETDPWNYAREFGAEFCLRDLGGFFEPEALAACTT